MTCDLNALLLPGEWQTPTFESGWSGSDVKYRLEGDVVRFVGVATVDTFFTGTQTILTLPTDYQPSADRLMCRQYDLEDVASVVVHTDGTVTVTSRPSGGAIIPVTLDGQFVL